MKITFLGTGTSQGIPVIGCDCVVCRSVDPRDKRLRSSVMVETAGERIIIDAGPDFRHQMLRTGVREISAILLTHGHKDHVGGLDDIRAFNYIQGQPVNIYCQQITRTAIEREFAYAFEEHKYPGVPDIIVQEIDNQSFVIKQIQVTPILAYHYNLEVFGYRIGDFTYLTDCNKIDESELEKIKGSKVFVINALRKQKHISHFTLNEALEIVDKVKPQRAFLTHVSHQMGLAAQVSQSLPDHVQFAADSLSICV